MTVKIKHLGNEPITGMPNICNGLTKREYFAGLAMQGLLSNPDFSIPAKDSRVYIAEKSVKLADVLLKELSKTE